MANTIKPVLGVVIPCFNEGKMLPITVAELSEKLSTLVSEGIISQESRIYFVDDGSTDNTWQLISDLADNSALVHGIKLTRNYGHQYALYAGLMEAEGDALISLDADLQDDIS
jgi:glycosyltransferase involved in cell wall biosynthesis